MKFRIIALFILLAFIIIPISLYWFFYVSKVSGVVFISDHPTPYTVELRGEISYKYFPLLDRELFYRSTCQGSCIFSPIPPAPYRLLVSSSGSEMIEDTLILKSGDDLRYPLEFVPSLSFLEVGILPKYEANGQNNIIGVTQMGKNVSYAVQKDNRIAIFLAEKKRENFTFSLPFTSMRLDKSQSFLIVESDRGEQYIFSLDGRDKIIFPLSEEALFVRYDGSWKVRTESGIYEYSGLEWKKNPRFTDYIDVSSRYRIGYIDRSSKDKLSLANLPLTEAVFILLDRTSTSMQIIQKGRDIEGFLIYDGSLAVVDTDGRVSKIEIEVDP